MSEEKDRGHGYAGGWSESGFDSSIPVWDGRGDSLRDFKRTVTWWLSSIDLSKTKYFNLAARFAMKQKGAARLRALEYSPEDLAYSPEESVPDPDHADEVLVLKAADYTCGVWKLIEAWETMVGKTPTDKKGELRERFYMNLKRAPGESVVNFSLRFRTAVSEMRAEGISLEDGEASWFFKQKLCLNEVQKQMLETTLGASTEVYAECEKEAVRLFKRIHQHGPSASPMPGPRRSFGKGSLGGKGSLWSRKGSSSSSTAMSSASSNFSRGSSRMGLGASAVNLTEQQEGEEEAEGDSFEAYEADGTIDEAEFHADDAELDPLQALQGEVEVLASELEAAAQEGCDSGELESLEEQLDGAVEALVTLREARSQIAAIRKDRGFRGPSPNSVNAGKKGGKGVKTGACHTCFQEGHWKGDPECPGPPAGKSNGKGKKGRLPSALKSVKREAQISEVNVIDLLPPLREVSFDAAEEVHEISVVENLSEVLSSLNHKSESTMLSQDKLLQAAIDSACNRSCAGVAWIQHTEAALQRAPEHIRALIQRVPEHERFRFGNGGQLVSEVRVRLPFVIAGRVVLVWISAVPCPSLGLLLGKDVLDSMGAVLDFLGNRMQFQLLAPNHWVYLHKLRAGHFAMPCLPTPLSQWPSLKSSPWISVGRGACCEVQVASKEQWILQKLERAVEVVHEACADVTEHVLSAEFLDPSFEQLSQFEHAPSVDMDSCGFQAEGRETPSPMASHDIAVVEQESVALVGSPAVDDPAAIYSVSSNSSSFSHYQGGMVGSDGRDGCQEDMAEILVSELQIRRPVPGVQFERMCSPTLTPGSSSRLHGRQPGAFYGSSLQEAQEEVAGSSSDGNTTASPTDSGGESHATSRLARAQRRIAEAQRRASQDRCSSTCSSGESGHSGADSSKAAAYGQGAGRRPNLEGRWRSVIASSSSDEGSSKAQRSSSAESFQRSFSRSHGAVANVGASDAPTGVGHGAGGGQPNVGSDSFLPTSSRVSRGVKQSIGTIAKGHFEKLKSGLRQTIRQGFMRLKRLHEALSVDFNEVEDCLVKSEYDLKMSIVTGERECFIGQTVLPDVSEFEGLVDQQLASMRAHEAQVASQPLLGETFTDTEQVKSQAEKRGHATMKSLTLGTGYDFMKKADQEQALREVDEADPFAEIIAFPCGVWSPLHALRARDRHRVLLLRWRRRKQRRLVAFAVKMARRQLARGKHFVIENPSRSLAWKVIPELKQLMNEAGIYLCTLDQCQFDLRGPQGGLHKKRTFILTSSEEVARELDGKLCPGTHEHEHVIGGNVASLAGRYPVPLAEAIVRGLERQFEKEGYAEFEVLVGEMDGADFADDEAEPEMNSSNPLEDDFDVEDDVKVDQAGVPTRAQKQAVLRLHQNTGHRAPLRLAKALATVGASPEVIRAAKEIQCEVCNETRRPPPHRPSSLPKPRQFGDQVHVDLVAVKDLHDQTIWVMHGIDAASGFQVAQTMEAKSSDEVVKFFNVHWIPILGAPKIVVADCGPEFTSDKMQNCMAFHDILLHHIPVESPWANGLAERAGGSLKVILGRLVKDFSCQGRRDVQEALAAAVDACNQDVGNVGYSPAQFVLGKQPRVTEEVIPNDLRLRLATHSLLENTPSLARQAALKEAARVAMVRLKYSSALRRAEFSRARKAADWQAYKIGDLVYFFRQQKVAPGGGNRGGRKKRLLLQQWHGPGMIAALEGGRIPTAAYVSYRGNLTKCAIEHLRPASTLERLAASDWSELLQEVIDATDDHPDSQQLSSILEDRAQEEVDDGAPGEDSLLEDLGPEFLQDGLVQPPSHSSSRSDHQPTQYPYPFAASDLIPLMQMSASQSSQVASGPTSLATSRRSSMASTAQPSSMPLMSPTAPVEKKDEEKLMTVEEEEKVVSPKAETEDLPAAIDVETAPEERATSSSSRLASSQGAVRRALSEPAGEEREAKRRVFAPLILGGRSIEVLMAEQDAAVHPLLRAIREAQDDLVNGKFFERDHGTWDGRWSFPSRSDWETFEAAGWLWPLGESEQHDTLEVQTGDSGHREMRWGAMNEETRAEFRKAAGEQWEKWLENGAIEVLSLAKSRSVLQELERKGELDRVLRPRFVLTDKNAPMRTASCPLPLKASARIVVPGYRDLANLRGELRRDAPTGSRLAQHLMFAIAAAHPDWFLRSADVRAAFLKGDPYVSRVLYITNTDGARGPTIPLPQGCIAKVLKGVFGLADAPREWWLRLDRELRTSGWTRSMLDGALWFLWDEVEGSNESSKKLRGVIVGHVDDLLFAGDQTALNSLMKLGEVLGYGSIEADDFHWCGKRIRRDPDSKEILVSMEKYHEQLKPLIIPRDRRRDLDARLSPQEVKKLRAILGSLQWLVAQVRFDMAFTVSSLQGEEHTVGTLLRANKALIDAKKDSSFQLRFKRIPLESAGIVVVTDAALGNVDQDGCTPLDPSKKVFSQSCYAVLLGDLSLISGKTGSFSVLDYKSHRMPRVCRSSYAAEVMGAEEGLDASELARGFVAEALGINVHSRFGAVEITRVPLTGVTDAKDCYDRVTKDTGFGSQKSLMFSVANIRQTLRRPQTSFRWTATANLFVDGGTKAMDTTHLKLILQKGEWSIEYQPEFIKQTYKRKKETELLANGMELPGREVDQRDFQLMQHVHHFGESPWMALCRWNRDSCCLPSWKFEKSSSTIFNSRFSSTDIDR